MNEILELSLESETFINLRNDFDKIMQNTISMMKQKGSNHSDITIKLAVNITKETGPQHVDRELDKPNFKHKITSELKMKDEVSGGFIGNYEMVFNQDEGKYQLIEIKDSQVGLFDEDIAEEPEDVGDNNVLSITGESIPQLTCEEEFINADVDMDEYEYEEPMED